MKREHLFCLLSAGLALAGCAAGDETRDEDPVSSAAAAATPVSGHPRLWVREADLPRLRSWATSSNPMFQNGLARAVAQAQADYDSLFFPSGQENPTWPDPGTDNWDAHVTEAYAEIFAFMSLVDPDATARAAHANKARRLLMHVITEAAKGVDGSASPAPFRSKAFSTYNRANYWAEAFGLTVDWIYPYLTAADKAAIRKVFLRWSDECVHASTTAGEHPQPIGAVNDPALLADQQQLRWAANNYYAGHMRSITLMSLAFDAADDPAVDGSRPATDLGNSLQSYQKNALGAWLYQQYAVYEDASVASAALGVSPSGLGVASGGQPVEGSLYGESQGFLHQALLGIYTSGYADPSLAGPQAGLVTSAYWDRFVDGFLHNIAPAGAVSQQSGYTYLGQLWQPATYGDVLREWITPEFMANFGTLGAYDQITGNTARLAKIRFIAENVLEGGPAKLYDRASKVWGNSYATLPILYFLVFDPAVGAAADPRPSLPKVFVDKPFGRVLARTDWTPQATWFTYLCNWQSINHQLGTCNQFELYRKGEWLTKERSGYANDLVGMTSDYHNTLAIQNAVPADLAWFEAETSKRGGQWTNGMNAGDPVVAQSSGAGWVYAGADATNLYNRPSTAMDIAHASRAVVWLAPDHVVVYDRATTKTSGRFKRFNLTLTGTPSVNGRTVDSVSASGQHLYVQSLLPAGATVKTSAAEDFNRVAELEPSRFRLVVEDPSSPNDVRFLHVLQGADAGASADAATLVASSSGTSFQGAVFGGKAVLFPVAAGGAFSGTTYALPAGVTTHLVTGMTPGASYSVATQASSSGGVVVSIASGGTLKADAAGVLVIAGGASTAPPPPPPPPAATCSYAISSTSASLAASGGAGSVSVTAPAGCAWSASSNAPWLTVTSGAPGTGGGSVSFQAAANTSTTARSGTLSVAGQTFTVQQAAAAAATTPTPTPTCSYALSSTTASLASAGGSGSVAVTAPAGCAWSASSNASWIWVMSGGTGSGPGTVGFQVTANTGTASRTGTITIAGSSFTIQQAAAGSTTTTCSYTLSASGASLPTSDTTRTFSLTAGAGCSWSASSDASWIWVYQPTSGTGSATITYRALANWGAARTGHVTIGGKAFTVRQAGLY